MQPNLLCRLLRSSTRQRPGAMLIITVVVLGAVALAVVFSGALRGLGEMSMGIAETRSKEALAGADACTEEAMLQLTLNTSYAGGTVTIGNTVCTIAVDTSSATLRTITVTAVRDRWTVRLKAVTDISGSRQSLVWWKQEM